MYDTGWTTFIRHTCIAKAIPKTTEFQSFVKMQRPRKSKTNDMGATSYDGSTISASSWRNTKIFLMAKKTILKVSQYRLAPVLKLFISLPNI